MTPLVSAKCTCGALQFEASTAPVTQMICHCTDCRAATGRPSCLTAFFHKGLSAIHGPQTAMHFVAASGARTERVACSQCQTVMFDTSEGFPELIGVIAAVIEPPFVAQPVCHMWVSSRVADCPIDDGLPQHSRGLPR
ncbi:GFA family protein [uncultured Roseobacter sp.]|uniref:GFA family protein n=1 Tax=uncultured Roseobacter sp. TaxID=114847 RepID=UPI00345ABA16